MINKKKLNFAKFSTFLSKKRSANPENTTYIIGLDGEVMIGMPDIMWQTICFIKDEQRIWAGGQIYDARDHGYIEEAIGTKAEYYTAEEANEINASTGANEGDENYISEGDIKSESTGLYKYVDDKAKAAEDSAMLTVDNDNKKIVVGDSTYNLQIDRDNNLIGLYEYIALNTPKVTKNGSASTSTTLEIDNTTTSLTLGFTFAGTNKDTATVTWEEINISDPNKNKVKEVIGTTTGTGSTMNIAIATPTNKRIAVSANDGTSETTHPTTYPTTGDYIHNIYWGYRVFWGGSSDAALTTLDGVSGSVAGKTVTGITSAVQTSAALSDKFIRLNEPGYIYYAAPTASPGTFYLTEVASESGVKASNPGSMIKTENTFTKYTSSTRTYTIYRSTELKAAGLYRLDI